jgi:MOSC domain-containing protein YiiM
VGRLISVNTGRPAQIAVRRGRPLMSAIGKAPVSGRVRVEGVNVGDDRQADLRFHGGADKAAYAYAGEDAAWWAAELGREIPPGMFGENLTLEGIDVSGAVIGERWRVGGVDLEVCQPRIPCAKLGHRFGDQRMVKRFAQASRPGAYLRIVSPGELGAGDAAEVLSRPAHGVTVALVSAAVLLDDSLRPRAAAVPELAADLRRYLLRDQAAA